LTVDILVIIILIAAGTYLWRSPELRWLGIGLVSIAAAFALVLIAAFTLVPRLVFRREPKFRDQYSLTFSADGIQFRTAHINSQLKWSMYSRALVDVHSYLLYYGSRQFTVIPKRVFQTSHQQQAFEHLLVQHVSPIVRREPRSI
jgi:hypothetical protein